MSSGKCRPFCPGLNTLRRRQNGSHFADDILKCIFLNWNIWIPIKISLKFVHKGPINNIPALVQVMAWHRSGDKPLSIYILICFRYWLFCNSRNIYFVSNDFCYLASHVKMKIFMTYASNIHFKWRTGKVGDEFLRRTDQLT